MHGFTLGVADILVNEKADKRRLRAVRKLRKSGDAVVRTVFHLPNNADEKRIRYLMATAYCNPRSESQNVQQLDFEMKKAMDEFSDLINKYVLHLIRKLNNDLIIF